MAKIIIEAAINGAVAKKTLNPNFACSPQEIADDAIATCEAGASIVHFHTRDPETGKFVFEHGDLYTETYRRARAKSKVMMWPGRTSCRCARATLTIPICCSAIPVRSTW